MRLISLLSVFRGILLIFVGHAEIEQLLKSSPESPLQFFTCLPDAQYMRRIHLEYFVQFRHEHHFVLQFHIP